MIGYRFLSLAEEEMTEAVVFYDAAFVGLGTTSSKTLLTPSILRGHIRKSEPQWT